MNKSQILDSLIERMTAAKEKCKNAEGIEILNEIIEWYENQKNLLTIYEIENGKVLSIHGSDTVYKMRPDPENAPIEITGNDNPIQIIVEQKPRKTFKERMAEELAKQKANPNE